MNRSRKIWSGSLVLVLVTVGVALLPALTRQGNFGDLWLERYERGDISGTLADIATRVPLTPELALLESQCYRRLGQIDQFKQWLPRGKKAGLDTATIQLSQDMFDVQLGNFDDSPTRTVRELERRGAPAREAWLVVVQGSIAQGELAEAERLIELGWDGEVPDSSPTSVAERHFLRALADRSHSRVGAVEQQLVDAIQVNPSHELAYLELLDFYWQAPSIQWEKSRYLLQQACLRFPANKSLPPRLAQINRQLGYLDEARKLLSNTGDANQESTQTELFELAQVALDSGEYSESIRLLEQVELHSAENLIGLIDTSFALNVQGQAAMSEALSERATWGAIAWSLSGRTAEALQVFDYALDRVARTRRYTDLRVKQRLYPQDQAIADELNAMLSPAYAPRYPTMAQVAREQRGDSQPPASEGEELYQTHCAVCHGSHGDGLGPAARHLFPLPRNFRAEPIRMVSATNRLATDADLVKTIREGLADTSMPPFAWLSNEQLSRLVETLRRWQREGLSEQYAAQLANSEDIHDDQQAADASVNNSAENADVTQVAIPRKVPVSETERRWIEQRLIPSEELSIPSNMEVRAATHLSDPSEKNSFEMGANLFRQAGCHLCHANSIEPLVAERRPSGTALFDSLGRPIKARELSRDPFRRGNSTSEIYRRLVLGIPGTPHPALAGFDHAQLIELVEFVAHLSISAKEKRKATNSERRQLTGSQLNLPHGPSE